MKHSLVQLFLTSRKHSKVIFLVIISYLLFPSENNINQINDAYLSNNQEPDREFIMLTMGNKTMEECGAFEIYRLACLH